MGVFNLDDNTDYEKTERKNWLAKNGYDKGTHSKFRVGQSVEFWGGYNNDIRYSSKIKGIDGPDLYVFNDCYWYPIQDDESRKITIL